MFPSFETFLVNTIWTLPDPRPRIAPLLFLKVGQLLLLKLLELSNGSLALGTTGYEI